MLDGCSRKIESLRLSVTHRCQQRCAYCSRDGGGKCIKETELSPAEFEKIAAACASLGFRKIRITGGEPLLRRDLTDIVSRISALGKYEDIAITTNAQMLAGKAETLKKAGIMRCNISLDSLNKEKYEAITGGSFDDVTNGIREAARVFAPPLKLNVVLLKGKNDGEIDDFISLARKYPCEVRFIELMPMGDGGFDGVSNSSILASHSYLLPCRGEIGSPAAMYSAEGFAGRVGFISPMSSCFCDSCNRLRITSDGFIRPCLGDNLEIPLRDVLDADPEALESRISQAIMQKPLRNAFGSNFETKRKMNNIGG